MIRAVLASLAATLMDLGTASPSTEINGNVTALGWPAAIALRILAVAVVAGTAAVLLHHERVWYRRIGGAGFAVAVIVGCVGALSNWWAR